MMVKGGAPRAGLIGNPWAATPDNNEMPTESSCEKPTGAVSAAGRPQMAYGGYQPGFSIVSTSTMRRC
jgi:hypothetical protein